MSRGEDKRHAKREEIWHVIGCVEVVAGPKYWEGEVEYRGKKYTVSGLTLEVVRQVLYDKLWAKVSCGR